MALAGFKKDFLGSDLAFPAVCCAAGNPA